MITKKQLREQMKKQHADLLEQNLKKLNAMIIVAGAYGNYRMPLGDVPDQVEDDVCAALRAAGYELIDTGDNLLVSWHD